MWKHPSSMQKVYCHKYCKIENKYSHLELIIALVYYLSLYQTVIIWLTEAHNILLNE